LFVLVPKIWQPPGYLLSDRQSQPLLRLEAKDRAGQHADFAGSDVDAGGVTGSAFPSAAATVTPGVLVIAVLVGVTHVTQALKIS
jgi:hypothetical protein